MVAANKNPVRCTVVAVRVSDDRWSRRGVASRDVLPWADPYVMMLIRKLQDEVRSERQHRTLVCEAYDETSHAMREFDPLADDVPSWATEMVDDLEMPWFEPQADCDTVVDDWMPELSGESNDPPLEQ